MKVMSPVHTHETAPRLTTDDGTTLSHSRTDQGFFFLSRQNYLITRGGSVNGEGEGKGKR